MVRLFAGFPAMSGPLPHLAAGRKRHMSLPFTKAVEGFLIACHARGLSPNTIEDYQRTFVKFSRHRPEDPHLDTLAGADIAAFLASCLAVSNKSKRNYYVGLSSLWTWALGEGLANRHVVRDVTPPEPEKRVIEPFTVGEIKSILGAVSRSRIYRSPTGQARDHALRSADRSRAIILLLLDTGMRASELTGLRMQDVDIKKNMVLVMGKGRKERLVPISSRTAQALWRYLAQREPRRPLDPVFVTTTGAPMGRRDLAHRLGEIGRRGGVANTHPHRFRHTFAINYLRNGGDIYTLQVILGHSSLEMVRHYARIAQMDVETAHRRASPVENWRL
jgi:integrase/recombinase XerD